MILLVRGWVHSDVLGYELIRSEVIHEVLGSYGEAAFVITIFLKNLVEALYHSLHHFFEASVHRLVLLTVLTDVLAKLLINLSDDTVEPVSHVLVSKFNLLIDLSGFVIEFLSRLDLDMKLVDFGVRRLTHHSQFIRRVSSFTYASLVI